MPVSAVAIALWTTAIAVRAALNDHLASLEDRSIIINITPRLAENANPS
jgi:hypothetical protein